MSDSFDRLLTKAREYYPSEPPMSQADLARALNQSDQTLTNWKDRGVSAFGALIAEQKLGINANWVLTGESKPKSFKHFDEDEPDHVALNALQQLPSSRRVPVVGEARLGSGGEYEFQEGSEHGDGFVLYPTADPRSYALRCKGDSMQPRINHGEYVVVLPGEPVKVGKDVAVRTKNGKHMIKRLMLRENGIVKLLSVNNDYAPITLEEHEIDTIHRVAGVVDDLMYYMDA